MERTLSLAALGAVLAAAALALLPGDTARAGRGGTGIAAPRALRPAPGISVSLPGLPRRDFRAPAAGSGAVPRLPGPSPRLVGAAASSPSGRTSLAAVADGGRSVAPSAPAITLLPRVGKSFEGLGDTGSYFPPDTMGAAGPGHLVCMYNSGFCVQEKGSGAVLPSFPMSLRAFWSSLLLPQTGEVPSRPFDPKILYDQYEGRFVAVSLEGAGDPLRSTLLLAVSSTSNPTDNWYQWALPMGSPADGSLGAPADDTWGDFPGLGADGENYYVTMNLFALTGSGGSSFSRSRILVVPKPDLAGAPPRPPLPGVLAFDDPTAGGFETAFTLQPVHAFGVAKAPWFVFSSGLASATVVPGLEAGNVRRRFLGVGELLDQDLDGEYDAFSHGYVEVPGYSDIVPPGSDTVLQRGGEQAVDWGDPRLLNAVYRDGMVYTAHATPHYVLPPTWDNLLAQQRFHADVSWYRLDPTLASGDLLSMVDNTTPHPYVPAEARIVRHLPLTADNTLRSYFYPSVAVNGRGDVALGFSGSSGVEHVSAYATGRTAGSASMLGIAPLRAGTGYYVRLDSNGRNRWGDYSATCVDPDDDTTFWTLQEYASVPDSTGGRFGTWWAALDVGSVPAPPSPGGEGIFGTGSGGCSAAGAPGAGGGAALLLPLVLLGAAAAARAIRKGRSGGR